MIIDRKEVQRLASCLHGILEHVRAIPQTVEVNRDVAIGVLEASQKQVNGWLAADPRWRPISEVPGSIPSAWIYGKAIGVRQGNLGKFNDGVIFGNVAGFHGCVVRDWEATHWMPCDAPEAPKS